MSRLRTTASRNGMSASIAVGPCFPALPVGFEGVPRGVRLDVDQWLAVRDRQHQRQRSVRGDRDRDRHCLSRYDPWVRIERHRERSPRADEATKPSFLHCRFLVRDPVPRVELDGHVDRAALDAQAAHEQCRRKEPAGDFGDHPFGEGQAGVVELPGRLEGRGVGSVSTRSSG